MNQRMYKIFLTLVVGLIFGSCSTVKYLSMEDPDLLYNKAMEYYEAEKWGRASRYFENAATAYIATPRQDSIAFFIARSKFKSGDYHTAIGYLNSYRMQFSRSPFVEDAEGMLTLSLYYISPGPERDQANTLQTLESINEFQSRYPNSEQRGMFEEIEQELIQRLHDRSYINAYTYYKIGRYKSAIVAFRNAIREYPESNNREKMMYYMVTSAYELAKNSIPSLEVDRYLAMIDMYYTFVAEFPESEYMKDLDKYNANAKAFLEKNDPDLKDDGENIVTE